MTKNSHTTREGWLVQAIGELDRAFFKERGYSLPEKLQASCGFPRGVSKAIGQCWDPAVSADDTTQMFICPSLGSPMEVLATLLHEMIHASVGIECKHRGAFRKLAKEFGLAGKMTATYAEPGSELHKSLEKIFGRLGDYPHAPMSKSAKKGKPTNGWIRLKSLEDEAYKVMISPKMMEAHGAPLDPWGSEMVPVE